MNTNPLRLARAALVATALLGILHGSASTTPIDDFEQGSFAYQTQTADGGTQSGLGILHCIASERQVLLTSHAGEPVGAQLDLASVVLDHEVTTVFGDGGGRLSFIYAMSAAGKDFTGGGQYGLMFVYMPTAVAGADLIVAMTDTDGAAATVTEPVTGPGFYLYSFVDFAGVDPTRVGEMRVVLDTPVVGDFHFRDIRLGSPDMQYPMEFETMQPDLAGPPYPAGPITFGGRGRLASGDELSFETLGVTLSDVMNRETGDPIALMGLGEDTGPGAQPGDRARVTIMDTELPQESQFEIHLGIGDDDYMFELVGGGEPIMPSPEGFILPLVHRVMLADGTVVGTVRHELLFEVPMGAPYQMSEISVSPAEGLNVSFVLTRTMSRAAGADGHFVTIDVTGDFAETATVGVEPGTAAVERLFRALPSVTTQGASFTLGSPRDHATEIALFDVAGRNVRTLTIAAGSSSVAWDGRDRAGRTLAPGVYLARFSDGPTTAASRIVKIR